jgi:tRNA(Arg) A34 adenosine deaminase TadA
VRAHNAGMCVAPTPEQLIDLANGLAAEAAQRGDRPYGAVLVSPHGEVVAMTSNREISSGDPTAHAEVELLRAAAASGVAPPLGGYTVAVNDQPCAMCAAATLDAGVGLLIYPVASGAVVKNSPSVLAEQLSARQSTPSPSSIVRNSE